MPLPSSTHEKLAKRKSAQNIADPKTKTKGRPIWEPRSLTEWEELWALSERKNQVAMCLGVSMETISNFLAREAKTQEETGVPSKWLESQKKASMRKKKFIHNAFLGKIEGGCTPSILFGMKAFCGAIEQEDQENLQIKEEQLKIQKQMFNLKLNEFYARLAEKFQLTKSEVENFCKKFFSDIGEM